MYFFSTCHSTFKRWRNLPINAEGSHRSRSAKLSQWKPQENKRIHSNKIVIWLDINTIFQDVADSIRNITETICPPSVVCVFFCIGYVLFLRRAAYITRRNVGNFIQSLGCVTEHGYIYISNLELDGGFLAHFVFTFHFMHSLISVSFVCLLITDMSVWMCVRCELKSKLDFAVNTGHISSVSRIARNGQQLLFCVCNYKANLSCLRQTFFFLCSSSKCLPAWIWFVLELLAFYLKHSSELDLNERPVNNWVCTYRGRFCHSLTLKSHDQSCTIWFTVFLRCFHLWKLNTPKGEQKLRTNKLETNPLQSNEQWNRIHSEHTFASTNPQNL